MAWNYLISLWKNFTFYCNLRICASVTSYESILNVMKFLMGLYIAHNCYIKLCLMNKDPEIWYFLLKTCFRIRIKIKRMNNLSILCHKTYQIISRATQGNFQSTDMLETNHHKDMRVLWWLSDGWNWDL